MVHTVTEQLSRQRADREKLDASCWKVGLPTSVEWPIAYADGGKWNTGHTYGAPIRGSDEKCMCVGYTHKYKRLGYQENDYNPSAVGNRDGKISGVCWPLA